MLSLLLSALGAAASQLDVDGDAALATRTVSNASSSAVYLDGKKLNDGFVFGCATSAYQVEGAWNVSGKSPSIWDVFTHEGGHVKKNQTGDVADDMYYKYPEDMKLFREAIGVDYYDFTIAWTRIVPNGTAGSPVNQASVQYYRDLIQASKDAGLGNFCTLYHWDIPEVLQQKYGSWLSDDVVSDFGAYAKVVFDNLGDVCENWVTMNEPRTFCTEGFGPYPESAPGVVGPIDDVYTCMHHALLSHAEAVKVFRDGGYPGRIGIKIDGTPALPLHDTAADRAAAERAMDFEMGWDVAPLYTGDYPPVMRETMGDRLKNFTTAQSKLLKGSVDFLGFDGYTSQWIAALTGNCTTDPSNDNWPECVKSYQRRPNGTFIGRRTQSSWNFQANSTAYLGLHYLHDKWGATNLILSENGLAVLNEPQLPLDENLLDVDRVEWFRSTLQNLKWLIDEDFPLIGFVPWSCIDNFEWSDGYGTSFGIIKNIFKTQERIPKLSASYLKSVMKGGKPIDPWGFA